MKRILTVLTAAFAALMVFLMPLKAAAVWVRDDYGILSGPETDKLNELAEAISAEYGVGTYIRVINGTDGKNVEAYAEEMFINEGMGLGSTGEGILLTIDMDGHYYDIAAHGDTANKQFTDYRKDRMAEDFLDDLSQGYYYNAFRTYLNDCDYYLRTEVVIYTPPKKTIGDFAPLFALPPLAGLITVMVQKRRLKTRGIRTTAGSYIPQGGVRLTNMIDMYLYREVHRTPIPKVESRSSGGGHETGHTTINAGGFSHHSGRF